MRKIKQSRTPQLLRIVSFLRKNKTGKLSDFANINQDGYWNATHDASILRQRGYIFLKDDTPRHHVYALCDSALDVVDKLIEVYGADYL